MVSGPAADGCRQTLLEVLLDDFVVVVLYIVEGAVWILQVGKQRAGAVRDPNLVRKYLIK